jgi:hypothetical protein
VPHPDVERPRDEWAPVDPPAGVAPPEAVLFVDGVRRTDAQVWVEGSGPEDGGVPSPALCASYAAGVVCCCADGAHLVSARVERGLFGTHPDGTDVVTWAGNYGFEHTTGQRGTAPAQVLSQGVQTKLAALELTVAVEAREHTRGPDLVVVDGQLRGAVGPPGAGPLPRTLGFVKTHSRTYLPPDLNPVVAALAHGQRTPVFRLAPAGEDDPLLTRFTWYLRLPVPARLALGPGWRGWSAAAGARWPRRWRWPTPARSRSSGSPPPPTRTPAPRRTCSPSPGWSGRCAAASASPPCSTGRCGARRSGVTGAGAPPRGRRSPCRGDGDGDATADELDFTTGATGVRRLTRSRSSPPTPARAGPGERANAQLNSRLVLRRIRSAPAARRPGSRPYRC